MVIVVVVPFLDEEANLPELLASLAAQTRLPDRLVLVDDGSTDRSHDLAARFALEHDWASALRRPPRAAERDRLASASEMTAFQWALEQVAEEWDVAAKIDADLRLPREMLAAIEREFETNPDLGLAGAYLSEVSADGTPVRLRIGPGHVHGATKFYRRECHAQISPLPEFLGWDTIDEVRARMLGWRTQSFAMPGGDPIHLRARGSHDGMLRGFRRWGRCSFALGEHPLHVCLYAVRQLRERPAVLGGLNYLYGWLAAAIRRVPRAEPALRAYVRAEQLRRIRSRARILANSWTAAGRP